MVFSLLIGIIMIVYGLKNKLDNIYKIFIVIFGVVFVLFAVYLSLPK